MRIDRRTYPAQAHGDPAVEEGLVIVVILTILKHYDDNMNAL